MRQTGEGLYEAELVRIKGELYLPNEPDEADACFAQALALARREPLDVVLMDIQMPRVNGLVAAERIRGDAQVRALGPTPRIVLVTAIDLDDHVPAAALAGAYAVLYKDVDPEALFETLNEAAAYRGEQ